MERAKVLLEGGVRWLQQGLISTEQLEAIKQGIIWELAVSHDSNSSVADYYVSSLPQLEMNGYLISHEAFIKDITPEDIHRVANLYLQDDSRVIIRSTPTFTYTQFVLVLGVLLIGAPGVGFYLLRRFVKRRRSRKGGTETPLATGSSL